MNKINEAPHNNVMTFNPLHLFQYEITVVWHSNNLLQYLNGNSGNEMHCSSTYRWIHHLRRVILMIKSFKDTVKVKMGFLSSDSLLFTFISSQLFGTLWKLNCELDFFFFFSLIYSLAAVNSFWGGMKIQVKWVEMFMTSDQNQTTSWSLAAHLKSFIAII